MRTFLKMTCALLTMLLLLSVGAFAESVCEHVYEEIVLTPATCAEKGIYMQHCTLCGARTYGAIEPAHVYHEEPDAIVAPSCNEEGGKVWYCIVCNAGQNPELDDVVCETIPAMHSFNEEVAYIPATCSEDGRFVHTCTVCGLVEVLQVDEQAKALGHDCQYLHLEANCESAEKYQISCRICGYVRWESKVVGSEPLGHQKPDKVDVLREADCENARLIAWDCVACGAHIVETDGEPLGHATEEVVKEEATCTAEGLADYVCSACGKVVEADVILPVASACSAYETVIAPAACTENGIAEYRCKWCDQHLWFSTIPFGHEAGDVVPQTSPSCTESGLGHVYCMVCNELLSEVVLPETGHDYAAQPQLVNDDCGGDVRAVLICFSCGHEELADIIERDAQHQHAYRYIAPDCENAGSLEVYCSVCDEVLQTIKVADDAALGHVYAAEKTVIDAPDCENTGSSAWICQRCSAIFDETVLDPLGHTAELQIVTEATCSSEGLGKYVCTVCDAVVEENVVLAQAAECEAKQEVLIAASCTEDGLCQYVCKWCDKAMGYAILPAGHTPGDVFVTPATCTTEGESLTVCALCNAEIARETLPCTEHVYSTQHSVQVQEATCTEGPLMQYYCEVCNADGLHTEYGVYTTHVGEALGHIWAEQNDYVAADCVNAGRTVKTCLTCGAQEVVSYDRSAPALGHRVIFSLKMPTCTEPMMVVGTCTVCDCEIECEEAQEIEGIHTAALGHSIPEEWQIEAAPDCQTSGLRVKRCTVCNEVVESEEMPAVPCQETLECVLQEADCRAELNKISLITCAWCDAIVRVQVDAYEHAFSEEDAVVLVEPTCETDGILLEKCALCGAEEKKVIPAIGHVASEPKVLPADCENPDRVVIACLRCNELLRLEAEMGEPLGHEFKVYDPALDTVVCIYCHAAEAK